MEQETKTVDATTAADQYNKELRYSEQDIDFERANARRAREEADALAQAMEESNSKLTESQQRINELEAKMNEYTKAVQNQQNQLADMDDDLVPAGVRKNLQTMLSRQQKIEEALEAERLERIKLETKARAYEDAENKRMMEQRKAETREKILKPLDEEFGSEFRNAALKLADEWVDTKKEKQPTDPIDAMTMMRKAYKEASRKKDSKRTVPSDTGESGITNTGESGIKDGTPAEVLDQMRKNPRLWKAT